MTDRHKWLETAVFYEIYPTSFFDSTGDGVGDIDGIISKLDYVASLNCNGIWLNPCFLSPFRDGGYDVTDFYKIDPRFGGNEAIKRFFDECHKRGIKVLLDLVLGHTSDTCEWFRQSQKAARNEYSDYYIWTNSVWDHTKGMDLRTTNGTSERDGNFVVNFFAMQPALNYGFKDPMASWQKDWRDPSFKKIHDQILDVMRFWLDMGADGFRVDMAGSLVKNDYPECSATAELWKILFASIRPQYPDAIFVSEWCMPEIAIAKAGFDMDFFIHIHTQSYNSLFRWEKAFLPFGDEDRVSVFRKDSPTGFETFFEYYDPSLKAIEGKGFVSVPTGNHDMARLASGRSDAEVITAIAFLMGLKSVPFIYYGDEIGMPYTLGLVNKDGGYNRTGGRTPMQWKPGKNLGFSTADQTYLPVPNDPEHTVERQEKDKNSILNKTRELTNIRRNEPALGASAEIKVLSKLSDCPFAFQRKFGKERIIVAVNPKGGKRSIKLDDKGTVLSAYNASYTKGEAKFSDFGYVIVKYN